jgi:hypothetical protein
MKVASHLIDERTLTVSEKIASVIPKNLYWGKHPISTLVITHIFFGLVSRFLISH